MNKYLLINSSIALLILFFSKSMLGQSVNFSDIANLPRGGAEEQKYRDMLQMATAAFECSVLASTNFDERERLFWIGYNYAFEVYSSIIYDIEITIPTKAATPEVMLGIMYGKAQTSLMEKRNNEFIYEGRISFVFEEEFAKRNCGLIGK